MMSKEVKTRIARFIQAFRSMDHEALMEIADEAPPDGSVTGEMCALAIQWNRAETSADVAYSALEDVLDKAEVIADATSIAAALAALPGSR